MYFALNPVKFDKNYSKGEEVPEEVISSNMVEKLIRCGVIQEIEKTDKQEGQPGGETGESSKEKAKTVKQSKKV